jgi:hypothetical protein
MQMMRPRPITAVQDTIFGNTYGGVPTPNTIIAHGYPTRYHGPVLTMPMQDYRFRRRPYAKASFVGLGDDALWRSISGSRIWDGIIGGAAGWIAAPKKDQEALFALAGAAGSAIIGWPAIAAMIGVGAFFKATKRYSTAAAGG